MTPEPDTRVDELRAQLRALGYLDAGVDRFVLGAAGGRRGPVAVAAGASVRVGLLGGALLGPAAAVGLGARLPGLVGGARDAIVLATYLAVFFFAGAAVAAFLVSIAAAAFARSGGGRFAARAGRASSAAAWVFTIASLLYLTLWWRNANAGFGWRAPAWTSFALLVAVAISLLLGHAVRVATLAALAARRAGARLPPVAARSWKLAAAGGGLAFAGASALLLMTVRFDADAAPSPPALTVVDSRAPIRLVALDGFDPGTYERLKDRLPNLRAALGRLPVRLQPQDTSDPARAWTTIATGVWPRTHGVHAIETRRVAGLSGAFAAGGRLQIVAIATDLLRLTRPSLASSQDRRTKTVWEVAEDAGLRTAVVNWWATWPAPRGGGPMITDRGLLRLERGGTLDAEIAPPSLYAALHAAWPAIRRRATAAAEAAVAGITDAAIASTLRRSAEIDATLIDLLRSLPPPRRDLDVIYLPGLDIAQIALLGAAGSASPSSVASSVNALERYYVFLDQAVAPLLDRGDATTVILITQPGRVRSAAGGLFAVLPGATADGTAGRSAPDPTSRSAQPSPVDVAPTVLFALGLPLSRELAGSALAALLSAGAPAADRFLPTYGRPFVGTARTAGTPLDQEMIDRLRSLGYVK